MDEMQREQLNRLQLVATALEALELMIRNGSSYERMEPIVAAGREAFRAYIEAAGLSGYEVEAVGPADDTVERLANEVLELRVEERVAELVEERYEAVLQEVMDDDLEDAVNELLEMENGDD